MYRKVWKWQLAIKRTQTIAMRRGARILSVQAQDGELVLWAVVDPMADIEQRAITIVGTGHDFDPINLKYVASVQLEGLVWHVFDGCEW